jgi:hypothetical protein
MGQDYESIKIRQMQRLLEHRKDDPRQYNTKASSPRLAPSTMVADHKLSTGLNKFHKAAQKRRWKLAKVDVFSDKDDT